MTGFSSSSTVGLKGTITMTAEAPRGTLSGGCGQTTCQQQRKGGGGFVIKFIETENSVFEVDTVAKTVTRIHGGDNPHWTDKVKAPYEFMQHTWDGCLYFHAFDPETGKLRPFVTSQVKTRDHPGYSGV